jgi:hypothetical protein
MTLSSSMRLLSFQCRPASPLPPLRAVARTLTGSADHNAIAACKAASPRNPPCHGGVMACHQSDRFCY